MRASSSEETAYAILAFLAARRHQLLPRDAALSLPAAGLWMRNHYTPLTYNGAALWLGKETYRPLRISRAFEVAATIAIIQEEEL